MGRHLPVLCMAFLLVGEIVCGFSGIAAAGMSDGSTYYGDPDVSSPAFLSLRDRKSKDYSLESRPPDGGKRWLLVVFPATEGWDVTSDRIQASFFQVILEDGRKVWPSGLSTDRANDPPHRRGGSPLALDLNSNAGTFSPGPGYPFAAVFEVPDSSRSGILRVSDKSLPITW